VLSVAADPDLPSAEVIASALLQLKNNPKLFKKWKKQPDLFSGEWEDVGDKYQLTRD